MKDVSLDDLIKKDKEKGKQQRSNKFKQQKVSFLVSAGKSPRQEDYQGSTNSGSGLKRETPFKQK